MANHAASWDMLVFTHVLIKKLAMVGGNIIKVHGKGNAAIPLQRQKQMITARAVFHRFSEGRYRYDDAEATAMIDLAEWLASEHARLNNHPLKASGLNAETFRAKSDIERPPAHEGSFRQAGLQASQMMAG